MDYSILLGFVEELLGKSFKKSKDNYAFHCPFCNHHKPKLEVNMVTNEKGQNHWNCWVCGTKGLTIKSLLYQLKVPKEQANEILKYVHKGDTYYQQESTTLELPEDFKSLITASNQSVIVNKIRNYLYSRGVSDLDILRYNIGYCTKGEYSGRIIIPSYDDQNKLNYFVGRSYEGHYLKYKNPPISRDVIIFENMINWNQPIVLVEGVFDAFSVKRNVIPILGKTLSKRLQKKILTSSLKDIYIALDKDAQKEALSHTQKLIEMGKNVYLVKIEDKDPSEMGFEKFTNLIQESEPITLTSLLQYKLQ